MTTPHTGLRVLYIAPVDDVDLAHNALRLRALERLGCAVTHLDPARAGWMERLVRRDMAHRVQVALDASDPQLVLVAGPGVVTPDLVDEVRKGRTARWLQVLGEDIGDQNAAAREAMAFDQVFAGATGAVAAFDRFGVKHAHYLAVGCDPSVYKPLRARGPFRANVVFRHPGPHSARPNSTNSTSIFSRRGVAPPAKTTLARNGPRARSGL